ncbi:MAG: hypothetical protein ACLFTK_03815, partial [Anaerolineales bacterium]
AAAPGEIVVWTITVNNPGTAPYVNVSVTDSVAPQFDVLDATSSQGAVTINGQDVLITAPVLNPGDTIAVQIRTRLRNAPLPPPFAAQGFEAACQGIVQVVQNFACVTHDASQDLTCAEANIICPPDTLPATGEIDQTRATAGSDVRALLALSLMVVALLSLGVGWWRRRRVVME